MAWGLASFNRRKANLFIQDHVIRFVEFKQPETLDIRQFGEKYLPEGLIKDGKIQDHETLSLILDECVSDWGIKGREVQFNVPDAKLVMRKQNLPAELKEEELKGYLYLELGSSIHVPFDNPVFDYVILKRSESSLEILLFAAAEEIVSDYTSMLEQAKLKPVVADASFLALYRYIFHRSLADQEEHVLCLQFDIQSIQLSIFHQHKPYFFNHLKMDVDLSKVTFNHAHNSQAAFWDGEPGYLHGEIDDMMLEIDRIAGHYRNNLSSGQESVTKILLTGEHPELVYVKEKLSARFSVPILIISSESNQRISADLPSRFDVVLGLGLKEVQHVS
ncbi:type IV pilus assembly protein PilM [Bacillus sp. OV194]|nr:type IV pilus assembly protein PilM [Bacillus sp. OV194]